MFKLHYQDQADRREFSSKAVLMCVSHILQMLARYAQLIGFHVRLVTQHNMSLPYGLRRLRGHSMAVSRCS